MSREGNRIDVPTNRVLMWPGLTEGGQVCADRP